MNRVFNSHKNFSSVAMGFQKVTHVIFDMDGLLLDTETLYTAATQKVLDPYGKTYTWDVKVTLMGLHHEEVAKRIVEIYELPLTWQEYSVLQRKYALEIMGDAKLQPGAERLLWHLHDMKVPICLATSSADHMVEVKTKNHKELFSLFHHKVCGSTDSDVKHGKPAPDIFLVAASRFPDKPPSKNCLVFEDAPNGVSAANAAGMQVVMVPDSHVPAEMCKEATQVLKSLEEFKPEDFGLPPYPK